MNKERLVNGMSLEDRVLECLAKSDTMTVQQSFDSLFLETPRLTESEFTDLV